MSDSGMRVTYSEVVNVVENEYAEIDEVYHGYHGVAVIRWTIDWKSYTKMAKTGKVWADMEDYDAFDRYVVVCTIECMGGVECEGKGYILGTHTSSCPCKRDVTKMDKEKYTISDAQGYPIAFANTPTGATRKANKAVKDHSVVYVQWRRASDGCVGYLNQDGNHAVVGRMWE